MRTSDPFVEHPELAALLEDVSALVLVGLDEAALHHFIFQELCQLADSAEEEVLHAEVAAILSA